MTTAKQKAELEREDKISVLLSLSATIKARYRRGILDREKLIKSLERIENKIIDGNSLELYEFHLNKLLMEM